MEFTAQHLSSSVTYDITIGAFSRIVNKHVQSITIFDCSIGRRSGQVKSVQKSLDRKL